MKKKIYIIILVIVCTFMGIEGQILLKKKNMLDGEGIKEKVLSTYNNPIVPKGFKKVETSEASWEVVNGVPKGWNNGLVIEDEKGNQFVWVPIDIEHTDYEPEETKFGYVYNKEEMNYNEREYAQILKYGGFYIARYEAGIPEEYIKYINENEVQTMMNNKEGIPTSKKNQIVWNYIDWNIAKKSAVNMYKENEFVESDLVSNKQWGTVVKWLEDSGYNVDDSAEWGNYSNVNFGFTGYYSSDGKTYKYGDNLLKQTSMLLSTGATERNKANNIYDLAGNIAEFMDLSTTSINGHVRGGYYDINSICSVSISMFSAEKNERQGFRVVLYFK